MEQEQPPLRLDVSDRVQHKQKYPGGSATPIELMKLADEYMKAALLLHDHGRRRRPLSWAPYRLCAIHAVELYLSALLLHTDHGPGYVRGLQHDLERRTDMAIAAGLKLKKLTSEHLRALNTNREYLVTRYCPELAGTSQINRLMATLKEVSSKVSRIIDPAKAIDCAQISKNSGAIAWFEFSGK